MTTDHGPRTSDLPPDALIIGAGIGGLATAWHLHRAGRRVLVVDGAARAGGVIGTSVREGNVCEHGPDSILSAKPAGLALIEALGLADRLQSTAPDARSSLIARGQRLIPVPDGLYLLAPAKLWPFLRSPLLSWPGKLRAAADLWLPRRSGDNKESEESLAQFVRRRMGREVLERIAQPLIGGIYTADPEQLSLAATMPQFLELEREHRSVILGLRARARQQAAQAQARGPRYGLFVTLRGGLQVLIDALTAALPADALRLGVRAVHATRSGDAWNVRLADGRVLRAPHLAVCTQANHAADLIDDGALAADLRGVPYAGVATVSLAWDAAAVPALPAAAGFVVPAVERRTLVACTFAHRKYAGRAADGTVLLRAFVGGALHPAALDLDDATLVARIRTDLAELCGIRAEPRWTLIHRWPGAMAQYVIGHQQRVARIRARAALLPGLALVGNGYEGVGIPDLAAQAATAARQITGGPG
jgi:oxygen-dependent protoporphyrinogen oxidase